MGEGEGSMVRGPRVVDVAEQILADIRRRRLQPGDAYLGTAETTQWLRMNGTTVNRALQLLAQRGVIERKQRRGTIVRNLEQKRPAGSLKRVHVIVREDHIRSEGLWADGVLLGLQGALPGVELQFNFRPHEDEAEYVKSLIDDILKSRQRAGLVLIRSTVVTQRLVLASGLPAVVSGTLQPSISGLPSIDRDQRQIGVLLAGHLLAARCRKVCIFMRDRLTAGDHLMLDGAKATLAAAGVRLSDVTFRFLPTDPEAIAAEAETLLEAARNRVGCLCRTETLACGIVVAAAKLRLKKVRQPVIVVAEAARRLSSDSPYPCIEPTIAAEDWGAALGEMLVSTARGQQPDPFRQIIPVRLWTPADQQENAA
jgi:DNA-binding LacI/PurR family transcriptional regulator